jgi:iron-sulfur cluster assembly accessory protein
VPQEADIIEVSGRLTSGRGEVEMIQLTDNAVNKVKNFATQSADYQGKDFRIYVEGGGCSGFSYGFTFDDKREDDEINEAGEIRVLIDPQSAKYLAGSKVDYIDDFRGSGFVIENPNTKGSCGCGSSVSF